MEKARLLEFESKCVQEEPPYCQAACPLHLDGRALCAFVREGRIDDARKLIERTLPLPEALARICDAPCREACLRRELGGAIELGALERACVEQGPLRRAPLLIPKNGKRVAVVGGGLSALCAASEGIRKGYSVAVFCAEDRAAALTALSPLITDEIARRELAWLEKGGVLFLPLEDLPPLSELSVRFDAAYAGLDDPFAACATAEATASVNPVSLETSVRGLFAGGAAPSFILRAADGRRGMKSAERFLQGASLFSSREKEGPYATRLFTSTEGMASAEPEAVPQEGYSPEEAIREAKRCILCECMECVKHCAYMQHYKGYPKKFAREIYNNLSVIQGTRLANGMINSCTLCGRCERICPNGFSMADLCREARREMLRQEKMPPSAHDFALEDMRFNNSPRATLLRHEPGKETSAYLFLPGCRLAGCTPEQTTALYAFLRDRLEGGVGFWLRCCGAPADWAGRDEELHREAAKITEEWESMGSPVVVAACTSCLQTFRKATPSIKAVSLWEILEGTELPEGALSFERTLAVADPCTAAQAPEIRDAVRNVASRAGVRFEEPLLSGEFSFCCGFGGLQESANPTLAALSAKTRGEESSLDFLVYCAMCRNLFTQAGKPAVHLLDILFPQGDEDPAGRPAIGYSEQQENRVGLVRALRASLWKEEDIVNEPHESIRLVIPPDVEKTLAKRRILADTVRRAIWSAERSGRKMKQINGALVASLRPASVTYWVEYAPKGDGSFEVRNGWSHRMFVAGAAENLVPDASEGDGA